jgi:uncharacterized protein
VPDTTQIVRRPLRYYYLRLLRQRDTPHQVALGLALGVFVGFLCPPGLHMFVALALAFALNANRIAAIAGSWVVNPLTMPFLYFLFVVLGKFLLGMEIGEQLPTPGKWWEIVTNYRAHGRFLKVFMTGAVIAAVPAAVVSYALTHFVVERYRRRRLARQALAAPATGKVATDAPPPTGLA